MGVEKKLAIDSQNFVLANNLCNRAISILEAGQFDEALMVLFNHGDFGHLSNFCVYTGGIGGAPNGKMEASQRLVPKEIRQKIHNPVNGIDIITNNLFLETFERDIKELKILAKRAGMSSIQSYDGYVQAIYYLNRESLDEAERLQAEKRVQMVGLLLNQAHESERNGLISKYKFLQTALVELNNFFKF